MKKLIFTLTVLSFSFLSFNSAKAYQDLNVTLDGVSYNLISPTNNWWTPGNEVQIAQLNGPGFNLGSIGGWSRIRGGTLPENAPIPTVGNSATSLSFNGPNSGDTNAFIAIVYATNGDRFALRYNRPDPSSTSLDGLTLTSLRKRPYGSTTWSNVATNAPGMAFPATLNMRDHIANENVKNFFEYGLSDGPYPVSVFSSAPTYYSAPTAPTGASGGTFVEQARELNTGLFFQDGQWTPAQ
jgi:hypothetical protein